MLTPDEEALLRTAPVFASLADPDYAIVRSALRERALTTGQLLFEQGRSGDSMAVLVRGQLTVSLQRPDESPLVLGIMLPGEVVGEMTCVDPAPRSATVQAEVDSSVLELDRNTLLAIREHAPRVVVGIVEGVVHQVTDRLREVNLRLEAELRRRGTPLPVPQAVAAPEPPASSRLAQAAFLPGRADLERTARLAGLPLSDLELLARVAPPVTYPGGALLCEEGRRGESCFLLLRGEVEVLKAGPRGTGLLAVLSEGALVGQMSLVDGSPRSATLRARSEVVLLELTRFDFQSLLVAVNPLAVRFQERIAAAGIRQLRLANQRLAELLGRAGAPRGSAAALDVGRAASKSWPPHTIVAGALRPAVERTATSPAPPRTSAPPRTPTPPVESVRRATTSSPALRPSATPAAVAVRPSVTSRPAGERTATPRPVLRAAEPRRGPQRSEDEEALAFLHAALSEWNLSLKELNQMKLVECEGIARPGERRPKK